MNRFFSSAKRILKISGISLLSLFAILIVIGIFAPSEPSDESSANSSNDTIPEITDSAVQGDITSEVSSSLDEDNSESNTTDSESSNETSEESDYSPESSSEYNSSSEPDSSSEPEPQEPSLPESPSESKPEPEPEPEDGELEIYFIDVGQADAALIVCDGETMLIDGGNAEDSNLMYAFLKKHNINHLNYVIGTHAHEDHIGGLAGALNYATVDTVYCPTDFYDTKAFQNFVKATTNRGATITIPSVGNSFNLGGAVCKILAVNTDKNDPNNSSIVLRIVYGDTSFLFMGDAEREVEQAILNSNEAVNSTVLKVGHHGSETSTSYVWLREIMPEYAVISVGKDNSYGHPTEDVLSRLRDADVKTFRTDLQGDIKCVSDGKNVVFSVTRNENADVFGDIGNNSTQNSEPNTEPEPEPEPDDPNESSDEVSNDVVYVTPTGKRYHLDPECGGKNSRAATLDEALNRGLTPCKTCAQ